MTTREGGLQVLLQRYEGGWSVLDWCQVATPPRESAWIPPIGWEALLTVPGMELSDGETDIPLLTEAELIMGRVRIREQEIIFTTLGVRAQGVLYEYPDLVLVDDGQSQVLACPFDDLHLPLGVGSGPLEDLLFQLGTNRAVVDSEQDADSWRQAYQQTPRQTQAGSF